MHSALPPVLIPEEKILSRVDELARAVSRDYADAGEILLAGILRGCFVFLADLSRRLEVPCRVDFLSLSSYGDATAPTGAVRILMDLRSDIAGRHVLLVDDIVDTGNTLHYLLQTLVPRRPASLKTCVLLRKADRMERTFPIDYLGFDIPDVWVVGYGLDWADRYRTLPYIGVVSPDPA